MNRHLGRSRASAPASLWTAVAVVFGVPVLIAAAVFGMPIAVGEFLHGRIGDPVPLCQPTAVQSWPLPPGTIRSV